MCPQIWPSGPSSHLGWCLHHRAGQPKDPTDSGAPTHKDALAGGEAHSVSIKREPTNFLDREREDEGHRDYYVRLGGRAGRSAPGPRRWPEERKHSRFLLGLLNTRVL